jgi:hypothetical protein
MKLVFISGPYRAKTGYLRQLNIDEARKHSIHLWQMGFACICPHMNTANFDGLAPDEVWLEGDIEMLRRCDMIYLLPNWEQSEGTRAEWAEAQRLGIPRLEIDDFE